MSRLYFLVFSGESRASDEIQHHIHESPGIMVGPLVVLAIGAGLAGFAGAPRARSSTIPTGTCSTASLGAGARHGARSPT